MAQPHVEAGLNNSTIALRVVGGNENGTQCVGGMTGPPCPWGVYKYGDLTLHIGGVSNLKQQNMVMSPAVPATENDWAGEGHQQKRQTVLSSERMLHKDYNRKCSGQKKILVVGLKGFGTKTNWLAVNRQS
jgi:hypothetical protein